MSDFSIVNQLVSDCSLPLLGTKFLLANGQDVTGHQNQAELNRVHQYLDENDLKHPPQEVTFGAEVLDPPYSFHEDMQLVHIDTGWRYVVRNIEAPYIADGRCFVHVLMVSVAKI